MRIDTLRATCVALAALMAATALPARAGQSGTPAAAPAEEAVTFTDEYLADEDNVERGKTIWSKQCRHCHGASAYPGKAPKLKPRRYTPEFVYDRVANGFRKMPAWKEVYSVDELKAIVAYVKSRSFSP